MAPSNADTASFAVITAVIGATILWWSTVYYRTWRAKKNKGGRRRRRSRAALQRRRTNNSREMHDRISQLFRNAKDVMDQVNSNRLGVNAVTAIVQPMREKASTLAYVVAASIQEKHDTVKLKHSRGEDVTEDNKVLSSTVAYTDGLVNELDEEINEEVTIATTEETKGDLQVLFDKLVEIAKALEVAERVGWKQDSPEFLKLQSDIQAKSHFSEALTTTSKLDDDEEEFEGCGHAFVRKYINIRFRQHPWFYGLYFIGYFGIIISHIVYIGSGRLRSKTFLSTPPQYDLDNVEIQQILLPVVFGLMHTALYNFGVLPVAMSRGLLRDLVKVFPRSRAYIPLDDMTWVHMLFGTLCIMHIFIATLIWLVMMSVSCFTDIYENDFLVVGGKNSRDRACLAFNPPIFDAKKGGEVLFDSLPGASYLDPRDNVLFLREIVWFTWMLFMPLIYWARRPNPNLPRLLRVWWFEICYYSHLIGGIASIILALYARFEVFYPMLIGGWSFYFIDKTREAIFKTYHTEMLVNASNPLSSSYHIKSEEGRPTVLAIKFTKPKGFENGRGQWLYVQCKGIDYVWHPFSMSSASGDKYVELLVGIQGQWPENKRDANGDWLQAKGEETWTYKLLKKFRKSANKSLRTRAHHNIKCKLRGPYGSPFSKCFDNKYPCVIVIGAGTGLTSALSVLKEMLQRRASGKSNQHIWFVWSCQRVDDLLMCWRALHELLFEAFQNGSISLGDQWNPLSNVMLDWLSMTIYVTRADREALIHFLDSSMPDKNGKKADTKKKRVKSAIEKDTFSIKSGDLEDMDKLAELEKEAEGAQAILQVDKPKVKKGLGGRWKKAVLKVAAHTGKLDGFTGWLLNLKNEGLPGDFVLRRSPYDHSLILSILIDGHFNQFEHHALRQFGKQAFTMDGRKLQKECFTPEEVVQHLSLVADGISLPLRLPRSAPGEENYMSTAAKNLLMIPDDDTTTATVTKHFHQGKTQKQRANEVEDIHTWMKEQVIETSMDNKNASIGNLFKWVKQYTSDPNNGIKGGEDAPIAICFCGPSALAQVIGKAASVISGSMEYSSEHQ